MDTYLFAHMPKQQDGRRAKAGVGLVGQVPITAASETAARKLFRDTYPEREIVSSGIAGVGA